MKCLIAGPLSLCFALVVALGACGGEAPDPAVKTVTAPSLAVSPGVLTLTAGAAPVPLFAVLAGADDALSWTLEGPGTLSATTGASVDYTPPPATDSPVRASITVEGAGTSASAAITVNPVTTRWSVSVSTGSDTNPGTDAKPFRTLTHALLVASAGQTVRLADGVYEAASGEVWPAVVPSGVALEALHPGQAVLSGPSDATALVLTGDAALQGLVVKGFARVFSGGEQAFGAVTLKDMVFDSTGLSFSGVMQGTLTGVTFENLDPDDTALSLTQASRVTMTGGSITGAGYDADCQGASGVSTRHASSADLEGVALSQLDRALSAMEISRVALTQSSIRSTALCYTEQSYSMDSASISLKASTVELSTGTAFRLAGRGCALRLEDTTVTASGVCVSAQQAERIDLIDSTLSDCNTGLDLSDGSATVTGSELTGNVTGIQTDDGTTLTIRTSTIHGGETALLLFTGADLGTASDPGGNTFAASTQVLTLSQGNVYAVGNTWLPNVQGSDAQGHYASPQTLSGTSGKNFQVYAGGTVNL